MMSIIDDIRAMSQEEKMELAAILKETTEPEPTRTTQVFSKPAPRGPRGELLTEEQAYDQEHHLFLRTHGFYESVDVMSGKEKRHYWTKEEINEWNLNVIQEWMKNKREVYPDCLEPEYDPETATVHFLYR